MQLAADRAARLLLPGPDPGEEGGAAEIAPALALEGELALDDHLGRDAGVIHAGLPERCVAPHAVEADQRVLDRVVERVPHVQAAGDVRRRHDDAIGRRVRIGRGPEKTAGLPQAVPPGLDLGRSVGLVQHRPIVPKRCA